MKTKRYFRQLRLLRLIDFFEDAQEKVAQAPTCGNKVNICRLLLTLTPPLTLMTWT